MISNIFKALYLIAFFCLVGVLFGIYQKMDNGRFQISEQNVLDTKNGKIYQYDASWGGYFRVNRNNIDKHNSIIPLKIKELPH